MHYIRIVQLRNHATAKRITILKPKPADQDRWDIIKKQEQDWAEQTARKAKSCPVSYTHLDVYKRQVLIVAFISARAITARAVISTKQQVKPTKMNLSLHGRF